MATTRTNVETGTGRRRSPALRSFIDYGLDLRNTSPDAFETYNEAKIADAFVNRWFRDSPHKELIHDMAEMLFRNRRRDFDPNWDEQVSSRTPVKPQSVPKRGDLQQAVMDSLSVKMQMPDGRSLGEWTFGEVRKQHKLFADFLSEFAHVSDNELVGKYLKK